MYAQVLKTDGFEFLIDPRHLWKPPRVVVRRGYITTEVWLDEDDISFMKPSKFAVRDQEQILTLVRENIDELLSWWVSLKNDVRRGRLERNNIMVD